MGKRLQTTTEFTQDDYRKILTGDEQLATLFVNKHPMTDQEDEVLTQLICVEEDIYDSRMYRATLYDGTAITFETLSLKNTEQDKVAMWLLERYDLKPMLLMEQIFNHRLVIVRGRVENN